MFSITIKRIVTLALVILSLIWGVILFLAFFDKSYQLFVPQLPSLTAPQATIESDIDFTQAGPWKQDLFMGSGTSSFFDGKSFLVHGVATPSAVIRNNEILVYFNYFPEKAPRIFGSIHQIKSTDNGRTWTKPILTKIFNSPPLSTLPSSPKAVVLPNGKIKLYFLAKKKEETTSKLFAAISDDGTTFVIDNSTKFEIEGQSLSSIALTILNNRMHLLGYTAEGSQTSTAYHAVSYDTSVFTRLADVTIKDSYYGQNTLTSESNELKLFGSSDKGLWISSSKDGNSWNSINYLSFNATNPGIVTNGEKYFLFYTAVTSVN